MELISFKGEHTLIPHFTQFIGHGAAIHRQKVRQLLTIKRNGKTATVLPLCLVRQIGYELCADGAFGHMPNFLYQFSVLLRYGEEQIFYYYGMKSTGRLAGSKDSLYIKEYYRAILLCNHII